MTLSICEVMSSTRLLTNFGATWKAGRVSTNRDWGRKGTYGWSTAVEIIQIMIQCIAVQLYSDNLLNCSSSYPKRLLQALQNPLAVLVGILYKFHQRRETG